jgi:hypothetical protein
VAGVPTEFSLTETHEIKINYVYKMESNCLIRCGYQFVLMDETSPDVRKPLPDMKGRYKRLIAEQIQLKKFNPN